MQAVGTWDWGPLAQSESPRGEPGESDDLETGEGEARPGRRHTSPVIERLAREEAASSERFVLTPHRPNYLLPLTYNTRPNDVPHLSTPGLTEGLDEFEVKFQLSFKVPVWRDLFHGAASLWFAYTQVSFWQLYKWDDSAPFRETNYMPEVMLVFTPGFRLAGLTGDLLILGFVHHSNGRAEALSRSWNRFFAQIILSRGNFALSIKPWYRIPESESEDGNPDIEDFFGPGEVGMAFRSGDHTLSLALRNNFRSDNRGAVMMDWTYPLSGRISGYLQYFKGYGESLIDYDHSVNRIGLGVALTTWM